MNERETLEYYESAKAFVNYGFLKPTETDIEARLVVNGCLCQDERGIRMTPYGLIRLEELRHEETKTKIKAFLDAFRVGPHPVNEGQIDMVAYDDYGGNPVYQEHESESDDDIVRRKALWALWEAVNSKSE